MDPLIDAAARALAAGLGGGRGPDLVVEAVGRLRAHSAAWTSNRV